jgi:hypothetical protein
MMEDKEVISTDQAPKAIGAYSQRVLVGMCLDQRKGLNGLYCEVREEE